MRRCPSLDRRVSHATLLLALLVPAVAMGQVPTFQDVTGHDFGERITLHHEMVSYLETLAEASPRVRLLEQGTSWEGRRLVAVVVTAPSNMERLEAIRRGSATLADPRGSTSSEIESVVAEQPIVVWYGGSIHGNELSGSEGLMKLLEHLTTRDDQATREVLEDAVVLIDPMLNPDGRDAFARANLETGGRRADPATENWGNDWDGWHGIKFRTGHYFFDTNRDWFAQTQAETRARVPTMLAWHPQVSVDAHEMGSDAEFYFDPAAEPYGPFFPSYARQGFELFNRAYAAAFDSAGFEYMTRERYNYFYPGYTT
ncbi:MAG: M14 family zinc carboxypeptidase, partial [Gemmatimonadota bacterium]